MSRVCFVHYRRISPTRGGVFNAAKMDVIHSSKYVKCVTRGSNSSRTIWPNAAETLLFFFLRDPSRYVLSVVVVLIVVGSDEVRLR